MGSRSRAGSRPAATVLCALALLCAGAPAAIAAPPAPAGFAVTATDGRSIEVGWDAPADTSLSTELRITDQGAPDGTQVVVLDPGERAWVAETICDGTYVFTARFVDGDDQPGPWVAVAQDSAACSVGLAPPAGLAVTGIQGGRFTVTWNAPPENDVALVDITARARSDGFAEPPSRVAWFETAATEKGLVCGTTYDVSVTFRTYGNEAQTSATTATTVPCATLGPAPPGPTNLRELPRSVLGQAFAWDPAPAGVDVVRTTTVIAPAGRAEFVAQDPGQITGRTAMPLFCGPYEFRVRWLLSDGRISTVSAIPVTATACVAPAAPRPAPAPTGGPQDIAVRLPRQRRPIAVRLDRRFALPGATVACPAENGLCTVQVTVRRVVRRESGPILGSVSVELPTGRRFQVVGRLSVQGARLLSRRGKLDVEVEVEAVQIVGNDFAQARATLVAPKRRSGR